MAAVLYFAIAVLLLGFSVKAFLYNNSSMSKLTILLVLSTGILIIGLVDNLLMEYREVILTPFMSIPYLFCLTLLYDYLISYYVDKSIYNGIKNVFYMLVVFYTLTIIGLSTVDGVQFYKNHAVFINIVFDIINLALLVMLVLVLLKQMPYRTAHQLPDILLTIGLLAVITIQFVVWTSLDQYNLKISFMIFAMMVSTFCILRLYQDNQGLLPLSKEQVIDHMEEMLIVADNNDIIVDINQSFQKTFDVNNTAIGMHVEDFMVGLPNISKDMYRKLIDEDETSISFVDDNGVKTYSVKITHVRNHLNKTIGKMILMYDITKIQEAMDYLEFIGNYDKLTKLHNRNYFEKALIDIDKENNLPISIIMGDLNGLKIINDIFGHIKGDEFLIKIADILKVACRKYRNIISRTGGDEFCILLPNVTNENAKDIIDEINQLVKEELGDQMGTISLGVATKVSYDQKLEEIYREADSNMYNNKQRDEKNNKNLIILAANNWVKTIPYETTQHNKHIEKLVVQLGKALNLSEVMLEELRLLSLLHDIGKFFVPEDILEKPSHLSNREWKKVKQHSVQGFKIAASSEELSTIASGILSHHERWDGLGYPQGLKGEQIPYLARVLSVVEAYVVMTSDRPYKITKTRSEALREIKRCSGSQFDPEISQIFVEMMMSNVS